MKYVISDQGEFAIGSGVFHKNFASGFKGRVIAAGLCRIVGGRVSVYGKSTGLGIEAREEDAEHLERLIEESSRERHES